MGDALRQKSMDLNEEAPGNICLALFVEHKM
jgi:hypothetical protein